jgi:hypothetical protein
MPRRREAIRRDLDAAALAEGNPPLLPAAPLWRTRSPCSRVSTVWLCLADTVAGLHYAFLGYLVVGGFLAWRWRWTIYGHLLSTVWAVLIVTTSVPCPLTALQNFFREQNGQPPLRPGFTEIYVRGTLYPTTSETLAQTLVGLVVVVSWVGFVLRSRSARIGDQAAAAVRT